MKYIFLITNCVLFTSVYCSPRVNTEDGGLIGTTYTLPNNRTVYAFLSVPFAAPPTGHLRFEDPKPPKRWFGYKNATKPSPYCVQFFHTPVLSEMIGQEDCLYLNIYTPRLPNDNNEDDEKLMNVLFYIYGGAFSAGSCSRIIPDYILQEKDILFVGLNYRAGPLGFFSTGDEVTPGNIGLKDKIAALRWVQKNIHHFGGDPDKVTVYGSSAGAASVQYLLLSDLSKGLFHNAISSGGATLAAWAYPRKKTIDNSVALASSLDCPTFSSHLMMLCLKRKPIRKLYEASFQFFTEKVPSQIPFGPVIEPESQDAFVSEHPYDLLKKGHVIDVPWMVGLVEKEASVPVMKFLTNDTKMKDLNDKWNHVAPDVFAYDDIECSQRRDNISTSVRKYYFENKVISNRTTKEMFQAFGDRLFYNGIIKSMKLHRSAITENTIFCYKFYYRGTGTHCDHHPNPVKKNYGACHGDDQFYLISFTNRTHYNDNVKSKIDLDMVNLSTSSVIAFMKTGNPNTPDVEWQPLSKNGTMNCLNIYSYSHQRMADVENASASKFWDDILQSEY
ncbi:carboxylic ester hydrolase-like [Planococcus citri]|uniref:carboxylic ester hydrolase-like n=1 Tax=Planococcus citri TaxID=170843 RepID=UPI0031F83B0C